MPFSTLKDYGQLVGNPIPFWCVNTKELNIIIGGNLKRLRLKAELTQEALAEILDISQGLIPRWESGAKGIGKDVMTKLCKLFHVRPIEFYYEATSSIVTDEEEKRILRNIRTSSDLKHKVMVITDALSHENDKSRGNITVQKKTRYRAKRQKSA